MRKIYSQINPPNLDYEYNSHEYLVDDSGYIPVNVQVSRFMTSGELLTSSRHVYDSDLDGVEYDTSETPDLTLSPQPASDDIVDQVDAVKRSEAILEARATQRVKKSKVSDSQVNSKSKISEPKTSSEVAELGE